MKIIKHEDIQSFILSNEELLLKKESFHNLILGLSYAIEKNQIEVSLPLFYSVEVNREIVGAALRSNHDKPLIITEMSNDQVDLLIKQLIAGNVKLAAVVGEENTATYFRDQWTKVYNLKSQVNLHLGVYECFNVIMPKSQNGMMIKASENHRDILDEYITGFMKDCFPAKAVVKEEVEKLINKHLKNETAFLLMSPDGSLVSMAANTRSTKKGGTISLVYTPTKYRAHGYASLLVALLSEKIINDGKEFSCLFTDLLNPTSNSIYQKVGFVKIGQNIHYDFFE